MGTTANVISALASLAQAGGTVYGATQAGAGPQVPKPTGPALDPSQMARAQLPGAKADAAARFGGGISPEFLASLIGQQTGSSEGSLNILQEIRRSMGPGP